MLLITQPRLNTVWIDHELDTTYIVHGRLLSGPCKGDMLVSARHGQRQWQDVMPLECFVTELTQVN